MLYLILGILCSALISLLMRYGEGKVKNNVAMFIFNYIVCVVLSCLFMNDFTLTKDKYPITIILGVVSGVLYLVNLVLMETNISRNGVVLTATFNKLGVIIPTFMAMILFKEEPKLQQILGIIIVIISIVIINKRKKKDEIAKSELLLLILLISSGLTDATSNIFDKLGNNELKDYFLLFIFASALICALILWKIKKQSISKWDIIIGVLVGVPNYLSSRFVLLALRSLPAIVVFPVYSVSTLAIITIAGILIFKERLSKNKITGILLIALALILLNI